jgi:FkbM family methyltransferase
MPRTIGKCYALFWSPKNPIEKHISAASLHTDNFQFLQIGANDGIINDPILKFILRDNWEGIRIEPLPVPFKKLKQLHQSSIKVKTVQGIVADCSGKMLLYHLSFSEKRWATGLASLDKSSLQRQIENGHVEKRANKFGDQLPANRTDWISEIELDVQDINRVVKEECKGHLHLLQIDTEGFDHVLVNALRFDELEIQMICFEKLHIPSNALQPCIERLRNFGYELLESDMDILAYKQ